MLGCVGAVVTGMNTMLFLPPIMMLLTFPRKVAGLHYFTFYAELLPHTEQVVFHKVGFFGRVKRIYVDIKNLEKIEADVVPSQILWSINFFDSNMIFRDMESKEIFVFDGTGIWNEDTLKHKLLH